MIGDAGGFLVWIGGAGLALSLPILLVREQRLSRERERLRLLEAERQRIAALRARHINHGKPSISSRIDEIERAGGAYLSFYGYYHEQSHSVSAGMSWSTSGGTSGPQGASSGWSSGVSAGSSHQIYKSFESASMVEITGGLFALWRTIETFSHPIEWAQEDDLFRVACEKAFEAPVQRIGTIEIAPLSEVNHRATSNSFYIYTVIDGKTYTIGTDTGLPSAREKAERIRSLLGEAKRSAVRPPRRGSGEGIPV